MSKNSTSRQNKLNVFELFMARLMIDAIRNDDRRWLREDLPLWVRAAGYRDAEFVTQFCESLIGRRLDNVQIQLHSYTRS